MVWASLLGRTGRAVQRIVLRGGVADVKDLEAGLAGKHDCSIYKTITIDRKPLAVG